MRNGPDLLASTSTITTALLAGCAFLAGWWLVGAGGPVEAAPRPAAVDAAPEPVQRVEPVAQTDPVQPPPAIVRPAAASPGLAAACSPQVPQVERLRALMRGGVVLGADQRDLAAALAQFLDAREGDALRNETLNLLLRDAPVERVLEALDQVIAAPAERSRFRSFAVQGLGRLHRRFTRVGDERATLTGARLHALIVHREEESRREAVWALADAGDAAAVALLRRCLVADEGRGFVDLAIRLVRQRDERAVLPHIRELASSPDHATAVAAIESLGAWADADSRSLLTEIAASGPVQRRSAARCALVRITGNDAPLPSLRDGDA